jgi:hypothetical protein
MPKVSSVQQLVLPAAPTSTRTARRFVGAFCTREDSSATMPSCSSAKSSAIACGTHAAKPASGSTWPGRPARRGRGRQPRPPAPPRGPCRSHRWTRRPPTRPTRQPVWRGPQCGASARQSCLVRTRRRLSNRAERLPPGRPTRRSSRPNGNALADRRAKQSHLSAPTRGRSTDAARLEPTLSDRPLRTRRVVLQSPAAVLRGVRPSARRGPAWAGGPDVPTTADAGKCTSGVGGVPVLAAALRPLSSRATPSAAYVATERCPPPAAAAAAAAAAAT